MLCHAVVGFSGPSSILLPRDRVSVLVVSRYSILSRCYSVGLGLILAITLWFSRYYHLMALDGEPMEGREVTLDETMDSKPIVEGSTDYEIAGNLDATGDDDDELTSGYLDVDDLMEASFPKAKVSKRVQLKTLMPTTRKALNVLNRVFNYSDRRKNVLVSGGYGTGKSYLIDAWLSNQRSLPRLDGVPLNVIRFDADALQDRLEQLTGISDIDLSDLLIALFRNLEEESQEDSRQRTVLLMDDADMASKVLKIAPSLQLVVQASNYDANKFVLQCQKRLKDFDVISMDEYLPTWRELVAEVSRVNTKRFQPVYRDRLKGDVLVDFMRAIWKLDSDSTKAPRMNDVVDLSIGRFIELIEQAHAKLMETDSTELSRSAIRRLAMDLYDEEPNVMTYEPVLAMDDAGDYSVQSAIDSPASDTIVWSGDSIDVGDTVSESDQAFEDKSVPGNLIRKKKSKPLPYSDVLTLADRLKAKIVNQDAAVDAIVDNVKIDAAGLRQPNRPIGVFLFEGPSGVGKTELARQLALELYSKPVRLQKLDMGEYTTDESAIKLFGAAVGYKDSDAGGQLTNAVLSDPQAVILFDEAEKANPKVWDSLLQVFNDGEMTDGLGHKVDFTNTIIILTSNLGNGQAQKSKSGFKIAGLPSGTAVKQPGGAEEYGKIAKTETEKYFKTEFLNRLDAIVVFNNLRKEDLRRILKIQIEEIADRLRVGKTPVSLNTDLDAELVEWLLAQSESVKFGAREMQRALKKKILLPLAEWMIQQDFNDNSALARNREYILDLAYDKGSDGVTFSLNEEREAGRDA